MLAIQSTPLSTVYRIRNEMFKIVLEQFTLLETYSDDDIAEIVRIIEFDRGKQLYLERLSTCNGWIVLPYVIDTENNIITYLES